MAEGNNKKKQQKQPGKTAKAAAAATSESLMDQMYRGTEVLSVKNVEERAAELMKRYHDPKTFDDQVVLIRKLIETTGTNVQQNDEDVHGDGDQTLLRTDQEAQVFRNLWTEGADMGLYLSCHRFSEFSLQCIQGNPTAIEELLKSAASDEARRLLLERRESSFRTPPLLLTIGFAKHPATVTASTGRQASDQDHEGVVRVLLKYGARPNVKDVAGKTAVHWGAGSVSTPSTRNMAHACILAARSCSAGVGTEVTLKDLSTEQYNGCSGTLGGYVGDRRAVTLKDFDKKVLSLHPRNIFKDDHCILNDDDESFNLVNVPDRLGAVALHEVVMRANEDVARFLCETHHASVDVAELTGITPRRMVMINIGGMGGTTAFDVIKAHCCTRQTGVEKQRKCSKCDKTEDTAASSKFSRCSKCAEAFYCSRECQKAHWSQHKLECKDKGITLSKPPKPMGDKSYFTVNSQGALKEEGGYNAPRGVGVNEKFWIKIQCISETVPHLVYDKTRTCGFSMYPGTPGFQEVLKKVQSEKATMGKKSHFKAEFDAQGDCIVYPHSAKLLDW